MAQQTQGPVERNYLPDWEKWHLGVSDEGLILNRKVWKEQMIRVKEGQDPIGIMRKSDEHQLIRITSDNVGNLTLEEGMRLYKMSQEERSAMIANEPSAAPRLPPDTGASRWPTPRSFSQAACSWAILGGIEAMSMKTAPRFIALTAPLSKNTSRTTGPLSRMERM